MEATNGGQRLLFFVVHLVRPIGNRIAKHKEQLTAVGAWMQASTKADPNAVVVVSGDTNRTLISPGSLLFGVGREAGELLGLKSTTATALADKYGEFRIP